jgi:TetR/AcrR family fatty acid metabolism transcriptional regulator
MSRSRSNIAATARHPRASTISGALERGPAGFQTAGQFRPDFDPHIMAIAIRAAIEAASPRLALDPEFDIDNYAGEIATIFDLATRARDTP